MQYTLILTEKAEGGIQVTIPGLPSCMVDAATRDEAIRSADDRSGNWGGAARVEMRLST